MEEKKLKIQMQEGAWILGNKDYEPLIELNTTKNEIDEVLAYNKNDVVATKLFLEATLGLTQYSQYKDKNKIKLRSELSKKFNISKSF